MPDVLLGTLGAGQGQGSAKAAFGQREERLLGLLKLPLAYEVLNGVVFPQEQSATECPSRDEPSLRQQVTHAESPAGDGEYSQHFLL